MRMGCSRGAVRHRPLWGQLHSTETDTRDEGYVKQDRVLKLKRKRDASNAKVGCDGV